MCTPRSKPISHTARDIRAEVASRWESGHKKDHKSPHYASKNLGLADRFRGCAPQGGLHVVGDHVRDRAARAVMNWHPCMKVHRAYASWRQVLTEVSCASDQDPHPAPSHLLRGSGDIALLRRGRAVTVMDKGTDRSGTLLPNRINPLPRRRFESDGVAGHLSYQISMRTVKAAQYRLGHPNATRIPAIWFAPRVGASDSKRLNVPTYHPRNGSRL